MLYVTFFRFSLLVVLGVSVVEPIMEHNFGFEVDRFVRNFISCNIFLLEFETIIYTNHNEDLPAFKGLILNTRKLAKGPGTRKPNLSVSVPSFPQSKESNSSN
jgi:hypothetical protein